MLPISLAHGKALMFHSIELRTYDFVYKLYFYVCAYALLLVINIRAVRDIYTYIEIYTTKEKPKQNKTAASIDAF